MLTSLSFAAGCEPSTGPGDRLSGGEGGRAGSHGAHGRGGDGGPGGQSLEVFVKTRSFQRGDDRSTRCCF